MTNNERFNRLLNGCQNPRAVYLALLSLAGTGQSEQAQKRGATV